MKITEDVEKISKPSNLTFFAQKSTLHGISHIFTHGRWTLRRILWATVFLMSLGFFLFLAYHRFAYYRSYSKISQLSEYEASAIKFPAITICNVNSFRISQITTEDYYHAGEFLGILDREGNLKSVFGDNRTLPDVLKKVKPILNQGKYFRVNRKQFNLLEFYNRTGHDLQDIVLECSYRGQNCKSKEDWSTIFTRYGKCYTFNSGTKYDPLTTMKGGIDNGLELLLDSQQDEYMPVWDTNDETSLEAGFKVQIHDMHEPPFIHELGFGVAPGFRTLVATQEQILSLLPYPWGDCTDKFDRSQHSFYDRYSISACRITCQTKFVEDNCSCRMLHMPGNATLCSLEEYVNCADRAIDYMLATDEKNCICRTPCLFRRYNLETSMLRFPSSRATKYLAWKHNVSEFYVKENFAKLNIFFKDIKFQVIEEKVAYEVYELLADIGGLMALFIGASILTFLEVFDYVYEVIKNKTWGRNTRRKNHEANRQATHTATTALIGD